MKRVFVKDLQDRAMVEAPFLVRDKIIGMAKNGRSYMTLKLMDCTGEVEGRIWDRVEEMSARFDKDDFVQVSGKASLYMGKMQLVVQELARVEEFDVEIADFLPVSARPVSEMVDELVSLVESFSDADLKRLMQAFLADDEFMAAYRRGSGSQDNASCLPWRVARAFVGCCCPGR